jgi:Ankyrin repeats (3 copies)
MSAPVRVQIGADADAAVMDLWRLAETNDTGQLEEILARGADIDARNVDGVTALMRAAYNGRIKMVRALIGHGADLNATRVDGFTPLGLAAFFGHTDVVKVLVESGADLSQATRFSTSAQMWASARSFYEIARYLEQARSSLTEFGSSPYSPGDGSVENLPSAKPVAADRQTPLKPDPAPEAPRLVYSDQSLSEQLEEVSGTAPSRERGEPLVVRTLKDPPEIWDLVHETPPQFNPGGAFVARLTSTNTKLIVLTLALLFVASLAVFAVMKLRNGARNSVVNVQASQESGTTKSESASQTSVSAPVSASGNASTNTQPSGENTFAAPTVPPPADSQSDSKAFASGIRIKRVRASGWSNNESNSSSIGAETGTARAPDTRAERQSPETAALKESNEKSSNDSASISKRSNTTLSPQLIAVPNSSATPKAKVIQWP